MSVNYAEGLSPYEHKGPCGQAELQDTTEEVDRKIKELVELIKYSKHMIVITGAGISTSSGIPDFRGPNGVWTLEKKGIKPEFNVTFEGAKPTPTHMALVALERAGILRYVITQNVDGLHLRSGFPRNRLSELHGDMFVEQCDKCNTQYINSTAVPTMALRPTGNPCTQRKSRGLCRGKLRDTILDWEDALPDEDFDRADLHARKSDLCLCLGTSLQILPCANLPLHAKRNGGKFVTVNLQATKHEKRANLKIHERVDKVMIEVCRQLDIEIPEFEKPAIFLQSVHTQDSEINSNIVVKDGLLLIKEEDFLKKEHLRLKDQYNVTNNVNTKDEIQSIEIKDTVDVKIEKEKTESSYENNTSKINTADGDIIKDETQDNMDTKDIMTEDKKLQSSCEINTRKTNTVDEDIINDEKQVNMDNVDIETEDEKLQSSGENNTTKNKTNSYIRETKTKHLVISDVASETLVKNEEEKEVVLLSVNNEGRENSDGKPNIIEISLVDKSCKFLLPGSSSSVDSSCSDSMINQIHDICCIPNKIKKMS